MSKIKVSMTIDEEIYDHFKRYCQENGMKFSTKVEQMMKGIVKDSSLNKFIK